MASRKRSWMVSSGEDMPPEFMEVLQDDNYDEDSDEDFDIGLPPSARQVHRSASPDPVPPSHSRILQSLKRMAGVMDEDSEDSERDEEEERVKSFASGADGASDDTDCAAPSTSSYGDQSSPPYVEEYLDADLLDLDEVVLPGSSSNAVSNVVSESNIDESVEEATLTGDTDWQPDEAQERTSNRGHHVVRGRAARGRSLTRGRATSRGRGRAGDRAATRGRGARGPLPVVMREWTRGDRFIELYPTDEDVPSDMRERIQGLMRARAMRESTARLRLERRMNENDDEVDMRTGSIFEEFNRMCEDEEASRFDWKPMDSFCGEREPFMVEQTGPTQVFESGYQAFRAVWTTDFLENIVLTTNQYASRVPPTETNFHKNWYDTNVHEILILFAFWMMMGVIRMPTISSCFSLNPLLKVDIFRRLFREKRYWALNRALYFAPPAVDGDSDKLRLVRPLLLHLNARFQELYVPRQNVCIDESLVLWKGMLSFRMYIKSKAARFGIEFFELCESLTGYLCEFFIYTGKESDSEQKKILRSTETVLRLIQTLLGKGHTLFMDNFFNSPIRARFLKRHKTDVVETLRRIRKDVPVLLAEQRLREGTFMARHAGDVVVQSFHDRKPVLTISTYHKTAQYETAAKPGRPSAFKLGVVKDYNAGMGGVDLKDQILEAHLVERKQCIRWFKKVFKRLLNVSIQNCRILVEQSLNKRLNNLGFRLKLVSDLVENHLNLVPHPPQHVRRQSVASYSGLDPGRLITTSAEFHSLRRMLPNLDQPRATNSRNSKNLRRCIWCSIRNHKRSRTVYECSVCLIPLCIEPCFAMYHTMH